MNNIFADTVSRTHPLQWITNEPLKRYKHGRQRLVPPFHLLREMLVKQSLFHGGGVLLPLPQNGNRSWACLTCMELQCWCPSGPCGQELSCRRGRGEEVDGESLRPNALSNTKKSFLPSPLLSLLFHLLNWLFPPRHKSGGPLESVRRRSYCRGSLAHMLARSIWHKWVLCQQHLQMTDL